MKPDMFIFTTDFPKRKTNLWPSLFTCGKKDVRPKTTLPPIDKQNNCANITAIRIVVLIFAVPVFQPFLFNRRNTCRAAPSLSSALSSLFSIHPPPFVPRKMEFKAP
jgi:hypothetical protein